MFFAIVAQRQLQAGYRFHPASLANRSPAAVVVNGDVIKCFAVAVIDFERLPIGRQARREIQVIDFQIQPTNDSVISRYIHPADPVYHVQPPGRRVAGWRKRRRQPRTVQLCISELPLRCRRDEPD